MSAWLPGPPRGAPRWPQSRLPHWPSQPVGAAPFLRPRSRSRASAKCSHIPRVSSVSEQLLQGLFSCVDLFFIVSEIHPKALAPGTSTASSPGPKYTPARFSESGPSLLEGWTPGSDPPTRKGDPRSHLPPAYGPRTDLRADYRGWMSGEEETLGRSQGGLS